MHSAGRRRAGARRHGAGPRDAMRALGREGQGPPPSLSTAPAVPDGLKWRDRPLFCAAVSAQQAEQRLFRAGCVPELGRRVSGRWLQGARPPSGPPAEPRADPVVAAQASAPPLLSILR